MRFQIDESKASEAKFRDTEKALKESELKYRAVADYTYDCEYWIALDGSLI